MNENLELNARVTPIKYLSNGLGLRLLTAEENFQFRMRLVLIIDETTRKDHVEKAWANIEAFRDDLHKLTGSDLSNKSGSVLLELYRLHKRGFGNGEIAKIINYRCLALILCAYSSGAKYEDVTTWGIGILGMYYLFDGLRLDGDLLAEQLNVGYEDLRDGKLPWKLKDGPFDTNRVKYQLRYFNDRIKKGQIIIKSDPDESFVCIEDTYLLSEGWYDKANDLIKKNDRVYWNNHKRWISNWLDILSQEIDPSSKPSIIDMR